MKHVIDGSFGINDCVPKISVGKYFSVEKQILLPVSITVNHSLMDGYHIGLFVERLNYELKEV
ncbi:CatA-like O-acetyltransferase [uncultured Bacteroides sp.]|uniref:CatA-like O-acetyltransferase n=1 Tax=uncultured Bacteroides sp. TaxID=162156 RepID=UPI002AAAA9C3|nr:CatA-like O-acetyltransferase [uncultured Bacteroides sp.]